MSGTSQRWIVIGNGMVGHRFCERLVELGLTREAEVTVFAEETRAAYDRVHLSEFFAGRGAEDLALTSPDWYAEHGFDLRLGRAVVAIDRARQEVVAQGDERFGYDALVLASGSAPFVLPIPGVNLPGVFRSSRHGRDRRRRSKGGRVRLGIPGSMYDAPRPCRRRKGKGGRGRIDPTDSCGGGRRAR